MINLGSKVKVKKVSSTTAPSMVKFLDEIATVVKVEKFYPVPFLLKFDNPEVEKLNMAYHTLHWNKENLEEL